MSYTMKKSFYGIPMAALTAVAGLDEWLQTFARGRAAQWSDIWVDICGGGMGLLIAALSVYIAIKIVKRRKHETR